MTEENEGKVTPQPKPKKQRKPVSPRMARTSIVVNIIVLALIIVGAVSAFLLHQSDTNPKFCATCHNMDEHVESYLTSDHLDNVHYQAGVQCKECHFEYTVTDEVVSGVNFLIGNYDDPIQKRKYSDDMCIECHISLDFQAVKTDFLSKNPHKSHWPDLSCSNCHQSHANQVDYCSQCHDNGGQRMVEDDEIIPRAENPWDDSGH